MQKLLGNLTIRARLVMVGALTVVGLLIAGGVGLMGLRSTQVVMDEMLDRPIVAVQELGQARAEVANARRFEKDSLLSFASESTRKDYVRRWGGKVGEIDAALKKALPLLEPAERANVEKAIANLAGYRSQLESVYARIDKGELRDMDAANKAMDAGKNFARDMDVALDALAADLAKDVQAHRAGLVRVQSSTRWWVGVPTLLVLVLLVALLWTMARAISASLDEARAVAQRVAAGDLSQDVAITRHDEVGAVLAALSEMQASLRRMVADVRSGTDSMTSASTEIAQGNADLSTRTEAQASNLQQTAASMEQLTSTVKQNADAAKQANQLAASASEVAARGGAVVGQVVSTMDGISAQSRKIAEIIGVIDGIAFQTNILALNAAVEAARAGEQGRGFAVVAGEVRNLAQRSAQAAREIKALISDSVEKVESGSRLVGEAGKTMDDIVAQVKRVTDLIGEITAATLEQSSGIGQVNQAVTQLDQMTQQNAALVEQSAAAAESMKEQARRLAEAVAVFRLRAVA
jgi:methyl-accepting chemotaxis protein